MRSPNKKALQDTGDSRVHAGQSHNNANPDFVKGDVIRDENFLIQGEVLSAGTLSFGRQEIPCYRVKVLSGHEKGKLSIIFKDGAALVVPRAKYRELVDFGGCHE